MSNREAELNLRQPTGASAVDERMVCGVRYAGSSRDASSGTAPGGQGPIREQGPTRVP